MQKSAALLQKLAQSSDPVTSLRARQLLVRFRRVASKSLIIPKIVELSYSYTKLPGTIEAMGLPDIGGMSVPMLIKQSRRHVKKVFDLFDKSYDALNLAKRYEGSHQPDRAVNLRKGAERLKLLAFAAFKDTISSFSWVHVLQHMVDSEGTPEAKKWTLDFSNRVKALESVQRNLDSVV